MTDSGHQLESSASADWHDGLHDRIRMQFERLVELSDRYSARVPDVSKWAVGQHVHHLGLAASSMMLSLLTGRMWEGTPSYPEMKSQILEKGKIPSGVTKAPAAVSPDALPDTQDILDRLGKARTRVESVMATDVRSSTMIHPVLGKMSRDEALRFIEVHNAHHLDIIDRILAAA